MSLELQSSILGERASRWIALAASEFILDTSLTQSVKERCEWLGSPSFYQHLNTRLNEHSLSTMQNFFLHRAILPFCEQIAPAVVQKTAEKAISTIVESAKPDAPFPQQLVTEKLGGISTYFTVLHSALQRASRATLVTGNIDEEIAKEMEKAQSSRYTTEALYEKILSKTISFCIRCTKEALLERLAKLPSYLYYPGKLAIESSFHGLDATITPILWWYGRSWVKEKVSRASSSDLRDWVEPEMLAHPLIAPFIHFITRVLDANIQNIKIYKDPARGPATGVDHQVWKQFLRQQILMLSLCSSSSMDQLRSSLESSHLQRLLGEIQDRFALDEVTKSVDGILGIIWQTMTEERVLERELHKLLADINGGFIRERPDKTAVPDLKDSYRSLSEFLITTKVRGTLNKVESAIDNGIGFLYSGWPAAKEALVGRTVNWLGMPIKKAIADKAIPLGMSVSRQAMEKIANFWSTSYNLRYGILHYQVLLPMV